LPGAVRVGASPLLTASLGMRAGEEGRKPHEGWLVVKAASLDVKLPNLEGSEARPPSGAARLAMPRRASGARAAPRSRGVGEDEPPDGCTEDRPWRGRTPRE
jgi:hypothetical protein